MKKFLLVLSTALMSSMSLLAQLPELYQYYKGDTLKGFDKQAVYQEALLHHIDSHDMTGYMKEAQKEFVIKKYNLPSSFFKKQGLRILPVLTSTCNNLDFETGDYTGWTAAIGYNQNSTLALTQSDAGVNTLGVNSAETSCSYHTLVNAGVDPYSALPMVDPGGGTWALRLGGENLNLNFPSILGGTCAAADPNGADSYSSGETIQQTFVVTPGNAMFTYSYMVVLEQTSGGHTNLQCPYFRAEVLDNTGAPIPCLQYYVVSDSSNSTAPPVGMNLSANTSSSGSQVFYSNWTKNSMNLTNYMTKTVTIRFTAAGCTLGGHFGYAYVDATCGPVQVLASSPEVCLGGTLSLTAPGAGATGTYAWQTMPTGTAGIVGSTTGQTVTLNASGTYQVTVTQAPGCFYVIDTTIAFYPNPTITLTSTNASCTPGNDGTATATVTGGNTPYTYSWSPAPGAGGTTATPTAMGAGTYTCTVTTTNGCTASATTTITQPPGAPTISIVNTPASCSPGGDGTATATVTGGTTPYTYSWTSANTITGGQGTNAITGLNGGTYTLTVTTTNVACPASATTVVTQPNGPSATSVNTNVKCFGGNDGTATATATGGSAPLTYSWTTANGTIGGGATTLTATGLTAGTYTFTVNDSKGCSSPTTVTVTQPPVLTLAASPVPATCNGKCNGQIICIPTGGTSNYSFSWNTGCLSASCTGICAGTYTATVTDAHGCTATNTTTVIQPTPLVMNMTPKASDCGKPDGKDSVFVSGGTPGYTYSWSPGAGSTTSSYTGLVPNTYTVHIKDNNGCPDSLTNVVPNLPGVVLAPVSTTRDSCNGGNNGTATVQATGGFPAYTYSWSPAPAAGQTTVTATGLIAGTYTCTVTDSAHCVSTTTLTIGQPPPVTLTCATPAPICIGACATLTPVGNGGTPGYTYVFSLAGTTLASGVVCPLVTTTYTVNCTDSHGCASPPTTVTVTVYPPVKVTATGTKQICPGASTPLGSIASLGNGGPYMYSWNPGTGLDNPAIANPNSTPTTTPMNYTVYATDGCTVDSAVVTISLFPPTVVNFTTKDTVKCAPVCANFTGTSAPACAVGTWSFGDGQNATGCGSVTHCYPVAGTYTVTYSVTDVNGCKGSFMVPNIINALPVPEAAFSASPQPTTIIDPEIFFTDQSTVTAGGTIKSWAWSFGDIAGATSTLQNPNYTYPDTGCFSVQLIVIAGNNCPDTMVHPVCIQPIFEFWAPNTFTPNGDGHNDTWSPNGVGIDPNNYHLMMFDRWGNLMWETHTWLEGWDGRANGGANIAQIDTYVWKVDLKDVFHNKHQYIGHANIIK